MTIVLALPAQVAAPPERITIKTRRTPKPEKPTKVMIERDQLFSFSTMAEEQGEEERENHQIMKVLPCPANPEATVSSSSRIVGSRSDKKGKATVHVVLGIAASSTCPHAKRNAKRGRKAKGDNETKRRRLVEQEHDDRDHVADLEASSSLSMGDNEEMNGSSGCSMLATDSASSSSSDGGSNVDCGDNFFSGSILFEPVVAEWPEVELFDWQGPLPCELDKTVGFMEDTSFLVNFFAGLLDDDDDANSKEGS